MEKAVENGGGGGSVIEQLAPFFDGTIGGHEGGAIFVTAQDDLQEDLTGFWGQGVKAPIKIFQGFGVAEAGQFLPSLDRALLAHVEFVLKDQLQKLSMRQLVRLGFLQPQLQAG